MLVGLLALVLGVCRRGTLPVLARLVLKHAVTVQHLLPADHVDVCLGVFPGQFDQSVEHFALSVLPHVSLGAPHHIQGVRLVPEEGVLAAQQVGNAGVRDDADTRPVPHVSLKAPRGRRVHADHALMVIDLSAAFTAAHVARAGHHSTVATAEHQVLSTQHKQGDIKHSRKVKNTSAMLKGQVKFDSARDTNQCSSRTKNKIRNTRRLQVRKGQNEQVKREQERERERTNKYKSNKTTEADI